MLLARLLAIVAFVCAAMAAEAREISITFDDAPIPDSPLSTGEARTEKLIAALQAAGIAQVAFFATPKIFSFSDEGRLRAYAGAGHLIANHTRNHGNLRQMTVTNYVSDILEADRVLSKLPNFRPWFRFPFLSEGDTIEKRDEVRKALRRIGYAQGYVTIDNYDWYLNKLANDARRARKTIDEAAFRTLYVETIMQAVEFYDAIAVKALGRSPKHVLLLHENDTSAMFIGDLAKALRAKGWKIISPDEAYRDPIAAIKPDTLFLGQGRVAAIAETKGMKRSDLVHEREDEAVLDKLFADRVKTGTITALRGPDHIVWTTTRGPFCGPCYSTWISVGYDGQVMIEQSYYRGEYTDVQTTRRSARVSPAIVAQFRNQLEPFRPSGPGDWTQPRSCPTALPDRTEIFVEWHDEHGLARQVSNSSCDPEMRVRMETALATAPALLEISDLRIRELQRGR